MKLGALILALFFLAPSAIAQSPWKTPCTEHGAPDLSRLRALFFEIDQVLPGSDALTILYTNERSQYVAETFVFGKDGKVIRSIAAYT